MDSKEIKELIELVSRSNFKTFELEREGFRIKLVREDSAVMSAAAAPPVRVVVEPAVQAASEPASQPLPPPATPLGVSDGLVELRSPIVGTFYRSSGPDSQSFVDIGSRVKKGQTVCIVEAMKVMNEIESEIDAEVVEVLVANGQPVEYGEILFRLRPVS